MCISVYVCAHARTHAYIHIYLAGVKSIESLYNGGVHFFSLQLLRLRGKNEKYDTVIGKVINRVQTNVAWYKKQKNEVTVEFDCSKYKTDSLKR